MAWVATAVIGSAVIGGAVQAYGASKASDAQQQAALTAANTQMNMYNTTRSDLAPYRATGNNAADLMNQKIGELTTPVSVNPQDFINSDQYKFLQTQGERGVTNSSAARGLASSGAALKGAAAFESGLNSQQWQQNFNNQVTNQTNAYNRLKGLIDTGENASAQTGSAGTAAANGASSAQIAGGNAAAAGYNGVSSAISNAANNAAGTTGLYGKSASYQSGGSIPGTIGQTSVNGLPLA